jgi:hypothetical protein
VDDLPGNDKALTRIERYGAIFQINEEPALKHVEKLVVTVVLVPMVFTLKYAQAHNGVVYLAERLVVPLEFAGVSKTLGVDGLKWFVQDVQASLVRIGLRFAHGLPQNSFAVWPSQAIDIDLSPSWAKNPPQFGRRSGIFTGLMLT